jgi:pimeloyl-ACP methyl ester carboxylesterase
LASSVATSPDGIPIRYEVRGKGSPGIVFVHGWSCDRSYWRAQLPRFAPKYRVVAIDLAGHGESGTGRTAWTMPNFGADVAAVVGRLGLERLVLVGHSMGGDVVVEAAIALGVRVIGLVWVDAYRSLGQPRTAAEIEAIIGPLRADFPRATRTMVRAMFAPKSDPRLVEWIASDMAAAPPEIAVDALARAVANDEPILEQLARVRAPIVAINPDHPPTDLESLRRYGVRTLLMSGVGHFPMLERSETFNRLLEGVLEEFVVLART